MFSRNFDFFFKFRKIPILVKYSKNFDFGQIFENNSIFVIDFRKISHFRKISKNFDLVKFSKKIRFWSKFRKNKTFSKILHLVQFSKNFDF